MSKHVMLVVVHVSLCAFAVSQPNLPNKEGLGKKRISNLNAGQQDDDDTPDNKANAR